MIIAIKCTMQHTHNKSEHAQTHKLSKTLTRWPEDPWHTVGMNNRRREKMMWEIKKGEGEEEKTEKLKAKWKGRYRMKRYEWNEKDGRMKDEERIRFSWNLSGRSAFQALPIIFHKLIYISSKTRSPHLLHFDFELYCSLKLIHFTYLLIFS